MVIFRTSDGKPGYRQAETISDAITMVERLRNDENAEAVRIYRMEEVAFEFKVRYEVELADGSEVTEAEADLDEHISKGPTPSVSSTPLFDQQRAAINPERAPAWVVDPEDVETKADEEPDSAEADVETPPRKGLFSR